MSHFTARVCSPFEFTILCEEGKRTYRLIFPFDAVAAFEERTNQRLLWPNDWTELPLKLMPELIFAGTRECHPELSIEDVTRQLRALAPGELCNLRLELLKFNFPRAFEKKEGCSEAEVPNG